VVQLAKGSCGKGNKLAGSVKSREFFRPLNDY
jgi:hypothetical protein